MTEFVAWPKTPRYYRDIVITEKIDGTNACVVFGENLELTVQSRKRIITPDDDNYGFSRWAHDNQDTLFADLGFGRHYGEWWGSGIQRGYGLKEKRFSLFNTKKWADAEFTTPNLGVVPVLYEGEHKASAIASALGGLMHDGSIAAPGYMNPEGICIYHTASGQVYKITLENDEQPKGQAA